MTTDSNILSEREQAQKQRKLLKSFFGGSKKQAAVLEEAKMNKKKKTKIPSQWVDKQEQQGIAIRREQMRKVSTKNPQDQYIFRSLLR